MSILNLPRFVFSGFTDWNPNTVNNSPLIYAENTGEPLPQAGVPWDKFVAWLLQSNGQKGDRCFPNGSWNVYGDHGVAFMNDKGNGATITQIAGAPSAASGDPLLGASVQISGLIYMDSKQPPPARLVDVEPYGSISSQIFYENVLVGDSTVGVKGRGACRMFSRWPITRNLGTLPIAGTMGVIWQSAVRNADLQWSGLASSPALQALQAAAESGKNQGILIQFASYRTLYFQTVTYQDRAIRSGADLVWAYANGYKGGNPARSVLLGVVGVWGPGELASAPTQRLLVPAGKVAEAATTGIKLRRNTGPEAAAAGAAPTQVTLGPAMAQVDTKRGVVAVDFLATFPEQDKNLEKANLGTFLLQAKAANDTTVDIGQPLPFSQYNRAAYEASGGVAEFPYQPSQLSAINNGTLQLVQQGSSAITVLLESPLVAETDQRGVYVDEGQTGTITVQVYDKGAAAGEGVQMLVAQYDLNNALITNPAKRVLDLTNVPASGVVPVKSGTASLQFTPLQPAVCYLQFFPFTGNTPPAPPAQGPSAPADFYAVVRALPFDNALEAKTPDSQLSWSFVYNQVLSAYDLVYPVMSLVRDLHNRNVVEAMAEQLKFAISLDTFNATLYMPITRELSAGKRKLLQRFINLLPNNVPPDPPTS
jgi:hypothetical protein